MATLSLDEARRRVAAALQRAGAHAAMAESTARALVLAEAQGLASHGLSRVAQYATHLKNGRVDGNAVAAVTKSKGAVAVIDAGEGRWPKASGARADSASPLSASCAAITPA
jgi:(2R)-3-sulfolactate dehydrogenase (NADP+)